MRGKKSDPVFVAKYIQESVSQGCETPEQIVTRAKKYIEEIDRQIKEAEQLKVVRSKVLDVIATFEKKNNDKSEDSKILSFFKLDYPTTCQFVCKLVKEKPIQVNSKNQPFGTSEPDPQMKFSIKQLIECQVLARVGETIIRGDRFDEYMTFILREE